MTVASLGMAAPWWRVHGSTLVSPQGELAFLSKWLGWYGGSLVPWALVLRWWTIALLFAFVSGAALALWTRRAWSAWLWYAIVLGCAAFAGYCLAALFLYVVCTPGDPSRFEDLWPAIAMLVWGSYWTCVTFLLARGITRWRKSLKLARELSG
jgi:hypothetical protein